MSGAALSGRRLLDPESTAAVVIGAHDWGTAQLGRAPSFLRSAKGLLHYLIDSAGLGLDPTLVIDLFDDPASAGEQLKRIRDTFDVLLRERRDEGRPVSDVLIYYVGHGHTDDQNHLSLLVRGSSHGMEAETGIKTPDLARVLRVATPHQRRMIVLDCCFSEAAARAFMGQSGALDQAVAATALTDLRDDQPQQGTLLLCSSPRSGVSIGAPNAARTLFTGAVLDVLTKGVEGKPSGLSFADLRDAAYDQMVRSFGANAPRPVLHQVNAMHGDLTRTPAFLNRKPLAPLALKPISQSNTEGVEHRDGENGGARQLTGEHLTRTKLTSQMKKTPQADMLWSRWSHWWIFILGRFVSLSDLLQRRWLLSIGLVLLIIMAVTAFELRQVIPILFKDITIFSPTVAQLSPNLVAQFTATIRIKHSGQKLSVDSAEERKCTKTYGELFVQIANNILMGRDLQDAARERVALALADVEDGEGTAEFADNNEFSLLIQRLFAWGLITPFGAYLRLTDYGQKQYSILTK
jgi:hypothetical protein